MMVRTKRTPRRSPGHLRHSQGIWAVRIRRREEPTIETTMKFRLPVPILFLAMLAVTATGCASINAVPNDIKIPGTVQVVPPTPDIPQEFAKFSGKWGGAWYLEADRTYVADAIFVVEWVGEHRATVFYAWAGRAANIYGQQYGSRYGAKIENNELTFTLRNQYATVITLRIDDKGVMWARGEGKYFFSAAWVGTFKRI